MRIPIRNTHPVLNIANGALVDLPAPSNLSIWWNFGSLLGLCLIIQILTGFLVFGSLFGYSLTFSWESLIWSFASLSIGSLMLNLGLLINIGVFPFHFWFPSVMAGLSWLSCLLLATWQNVAPIFLIAIILDASLLYTLFLLLCFLGAGSSLIGGVGGINQTQIRCAWSLIILSIHQWPATSFNLQNRTMWSFCWWHFHSYD